MKTATDTRLLFNRFTLQMLRNPVWLFVGFSTPILYLVLFTPLLKDLSNGQRLRRHAGARRRSCPASSPSSRSRAGRRAGSARSSSCSPA